MTKIQDTVTYFDGSVANGKIVVTWPPFQSGGVAVAAGQQEYPIAPDGSVTIECYPCVGAQPIGTYYTATYELDKGAVYDEYWLVPATPTATIGTIRVSVPETPSIMINAQQLTSGGAQSGMFLGWNGSNWVPMYPSSFNCAVRSFFGRTGDVMPQTGDYTVAQVTDAVPDTRRIIAGSGLAGGGPLTGDVTLSVASGGFVPATTQIIAGPGLSGGGPLTGNVTLSVTAGMFALQVTQIIAGTGLTGGGPLSGNVTLSVASGTTVPTSTQVIAGYGLSGGGPLTGNVTLAVVDNSSVQKLQLALAGALTATRHRLNFVAGSGINLNLVDDGTNDEGTLTLTAVATGAPSPSIFAVNGNPIGTQPELNLIASTNVTLVGVNNTGAGRVDITISATGGGPLTPWTSDIDAAGFNLNHAGAIGIGTVAGARTLTIQGAAATSFDISAINSNPAASLGMYLQNDLNDQVQFGLGGSNVGAANLRRVAFLYTTRDLSFGTGTTLTERMRITAVGLVGIGRVPTTYPLEVAGDVNLISGVYRVNGVPLATGGTPAGSTGQVQFNIAGAFGASANLFWDNTNFRLGVGAAAPAYKLDIAGDCNLSVGSVYRINGVPISTGGAAQTPWTSDINAAGFTLYSAGKIGIGNVPANALDVGTGAIGAVGGVQMTVTSNTANSGISIGQNAANRGRMLWFYNATVASAYMTVECLGGNPLCLQTLGGNVGIGNTAGVLPDAAVTNLQVIIGVTTGADAASELHIAGLATVSGNAVGLLSFPNYAITGTDKRLAAITANAVGGLNNGDMRILTMNAGALTEKMRVTAGGNVGVGTTNPVLPLSIVGTVAGVYNGVVIANLNSTVGSAAVLGFAMGNQGGTPTASIANVLESAAGGGLAFSTYNSGIVERMRITAAGNVGIGTTSPGGALEVNAFQKWAVFSSNVGTVLPPNQSGVFLGWNYSGGSGEADLAFNGGGLTFNDTTGNTWKERMRITAAGNVGIGTTSPTTVLSLGAGLAPIKLSIYDGGAGNCYGMGVQSGYLTFIAGLNPTSGTPQMVLMSTGNVGIGTTSPGSQLTVIPATTPSTVATINQIAIGEATNNSAYRLSLGYGAIGGANVGVVQAIQNAAGTYLLLNPSGGNVGIGKTAPAFALDVTGDCNVTGVYRVNGTPISAGGGPTTQSNATGARSFGTVYQNTTGKPMFISITVSASSGSGISCYTDTSSNPSTAVAFASSFYSTGASNVGCSFWVLPNSYYKVTGASSLNAWFEWW